MTGLLAGRLLAIYAVFIVYGSLVPLAFTPLPWAQAWAAFKSTPLLQLGVESRADWIANGVLYLPLGWLATLALLRRHGGVAAGVLAWSACALLALAVEFAQLYFPPRTVSQNDLLAEGLGSALGVLLAPWSAPWLQRAASAQNRASWAARWLPAYALAYVALAFFPFDLLISAAELQAKLASDLWGWLLAEGGPMAVLKLAVETVLTMPLGLWLVRVRGRHGVSWVAAAGVGALLGAVIELGQFFIASGVSQGASVATRAGGFALGCLFARRLAAGPWRLRPIVQRWAALGVPVWLLLVLAASGLFTRSWQGGEAAAAAWREMRLLPFYYHYYTTEALALVSLGSVFIMYLPLALLAWARSWRPGAAVVLVALLAGLVETAKLFVAGRHPDPTNVLIAVAAVAAGMRLLALAHDRPPPAQRAAARAGHAAGHAAEGGTGVAGAGAIQSTEPRAGRSAMSGGVPAAASLRTALQPLFLLGGGLGLVGALLFPFAPAALLLGLLGCAVLTWRWPMLPLLLLPAALPVLDLAPWSGRFFWDEFDLLAAACLGVAWQRTRAAPPSRQARGMRLAFAVLALSLLASTLRALWPWPGIDDNSFNNYHSAFNALRIVKGAAWAALFVALWRRLYPHGAARGRWFTGGMVLGLALTVVSVVLERASFVGLADFAADYRVTGLISAMHKGGALIECWLAVAGAFAVAWVLRPRALWLRPAGGLLLAGCAYAMAVTYSRNGYAALAVAVVVVLACAALQQRGRGKRLPMWATAVVLLGTVAIAWPVLTGSFARQRLAASAEDLAARQAHWQDGLRLRASAGADTLLGIGIGRYPQAHFWRSDEPARAATYSLGRDAQGPFLRLGSGATLYIEQIVTPPPPGEIRLSLRLRVPAPAAGLPALRVTLCEKWTLTSRGCVTGEARPIAAAAPGGWHAASLLLDPTGLLTAPGRLRPPLKFSLLTPEQAAVDVADVRLVDASGQALLVNGDFAAGLDRWFFATDNVKPWQMDSLPLTVLVEQGWLGMLAWAAVLAGALGSAARLAWLGRAEVLAAPAALLAFLVCGVLNTLIDAPRFLWLLLVLAWLCTRASRPGRRAVPAVAGPVAAP